MRDLIWATILRPFRRWRRWYLWSYPMDGGEPTVTRAPHPIKPEEFFSKDPRHPRIDPGPGYRRNTDRAHS